MATVKMAELKAEMDQSVFSACAKTALTIEAVVQLSTTPQLSALDIGARQEGVQSQAEQIVTQGTQDGIGVEQALDTSPANFLLQLVKTKV
jgi:hypothetical protein